MGDPPLAKSIILYNKILRFTETCILYELDKHFGTTSFKNKIMGNLPPPPPWYG